MTPKIVIAIWILKLGRFVGLHDLVNAVEQAMSERPRTMTAEREAQILAAVRQNWTYKDSGQSIAWLDAERIAHDSSEQTIRELREHNAELVHAPCRGCEVLQPDLQRERKLSDQLAETLRKTQRIIREGDSLCDEVKAALAQHTALRRYCCP